jgi:hypothetical protein
LSKLLTSQTWLHRLGIGRISFHVLQNVCFDEAEQLIFITCVENVFCPPVGSKFFMAKMRVFRLQPSFDDSSKVECLIRDARFSLIAALYLL